MKDLPDETLKELLNQIAQGSDKAVTRLYRHYHGLIYAYVRHKMPDDAEAEEVAHDVFLALCNKPEGFKGDSLFSSYLCGIANFKVVDWYRAKGRSLPQNLGRADADDQNGEDDFPDPGPTPLDTVEKEQLMKVLHKCLASLPSDQREATFLAYFQDEGVTGIANWLKCPEGTVKSKLFNARKRLFDCVTRKLGGKPA